jgi:hypothetical protein
VLAGCGGGGAADASTATSIVRSAADATAKASGFTFKLPAAEITYNAPDRIEQVEHGEATSASAGNGEPPHSAAPMPATITKIIIGDRYYDTTTTDGQPAAFTVSKRCPPDNAADVVLGVLRSIAANGRAEGSGGNYTFTVPGSNSTETTTGTLTIEAGFVHRLAITSGTVAPTVTIESVGTSPPITAPTNASPASSSCG